MPEKFLNITVPEEVLIVRNSGARARPALANLVALDDLVSVENVLVVGHTDCGARNFNDGEIRARLMKRAPEYKEEIERMQFGKILGDVEHSVKDDVEFLKGSPLLREELKQNIQGYRLILVLLGESQVMAGGALVTPVKGENLVLQGVRRDATAPPPQHLETASKGFKSMEDVGTSASKILEWTWDKPTTRIDHPVFPGFERNIQIYASSNSESTEAIADLRKLVDSTRQAGLRCLYDGQQLQLR
ncbi:uncharacterized protein BHQ10_009446 [Talaromyces amestolkiae]|uniref:Carbonic anhydrase n=1 Tax=Talaromyces amestolkiae TaxID=1196081 RepID=A0A364LC91_TALAM|nr:uncharacterized protein BHQ10_009446 [Talaromyces amestolkiae]RAO73434.1 hypothetical protein BHQ10_009446 [Talaromyces amestolkiae]